MLILTAIISNSHSACLFLILSIYSLVKIRERLTRNRRLQQIIQQGREAAGNRRRAADNPDGPDDACLEDMSGEGGEVIQPIGEADLPGHVVVEAEVDKKIEIDFPADDQSTDERAIGVQQMFMASEAGPAATQGVEIELKRRKVAIHCSNEVAE